MPSTRAIASAVVPILPIALVALVACAPPSPLEERRPAPVARSEASAPTGSMVEPPPAAPPAPATLERILVAGDLPATLVRGRSGGAPAIVFLPGVCSNAAAYLQAFPEAARAHGGVLAIEGDQRCGDDPSFRTFGSDRLRQHARIEAALAAAGAVGIPAEGITLVGYSQGASIAEELAGRFPTRYARVVLIGSPKDPQPARLGGARGVVTMSCELDVPGRMRDAARRIADRGAPATYLQMPGCTHGHLAAAEAVFDEAFGWLAASALPPEPGTLPTPIAGPVP